MNILEALLPLFLLMCAGAAILLAVRHIGRRRGKGLPRDPLEELFLDKDDEGD